MKLFKSAIVAFSLALSLGTFSTSAVACEDGRTCYGPLEGINLVLGHIAEAIKAIDEGADKDAVLKHIRLAKNASKEINANDRVDRNRLRANGYIKKARTAIKNGDAQMGQDHLGEAERRFEGLKKLL